MIQLCFRFVIGGFFLLMPLTAFAGQVIGEIVAVSGSVTIRDDKARKARAHLGMTIETS